MKKSEYTDAVRQIAFITTLYLSDKIEGIDKAVAEYKDYIAAAERGIYGFDKDEIEGELLSFMRDNGYKSSDDMDENIRTLTEIFRWDYGRMLGKVQPISEKDDAGSYEDVKALNEVFLQNPSEVGRRWEKSRDVEYSLLNAGDGCLDVYYECDFEEEG